MRRCGSFATLDSELLRKSTFVYATRGLNRSVINRCDGGWKNWRLGHRFENDRDTVRRSGVDVQAYKIEQCSVYL